MGQRKPSLATRIAEWERRVKRPLTPNEAKRLAALLRVMLQADAPPARSEQKTLKH